MLEKCLKIKDLAPGAVFVYNATVYLKLVESLALYNVVEVASGKLDWLISDTEVFLMTDGNILAAQALSCVSDPVQKIAWSGSLADLDHVDILLENFR